MAYRGQNYQDDYCGYGDSMYMSPSADAMMERKIVDVLSKMLGNSMNLQQGMDYEMCSYTDDQRYGNQSGRKRRNKGKSGDESKKQTDKTDVQDKNVASDSKKTKKTGSQRGTPKKDMGRFEPKTYCYVCSLECRSEKDLENHLLGRRHKISVEGSDRIVGRLGKDSEPYCKFCCVHFTEKDWAAHKETAEHKAKSALRVKVPRVSSEPEGVEFITPVSGFFCKLCHRFYTDEETAKENHCKSREHLHKVQRDILVRKYDAEMKEYLAKKKEKKAAETTAKENGEKESKDSDEQEIVQEKDADDKNPEESAVKDEYRKVNSE